MNILNSPGCFWDPFDMRSIAMRCIPHQQNFAAVWCEFDSIIEQINQYLPNAPFVKVDGGQVGRNL